MPQLYREHIRAALAHNHPPSAPTTEQKQAAVAMLLHGDSAREMFFIVRSEHEDDPWSGDIGFPGGKIEPGESVQQTAERETLEEVAIDLSTAELLGYLEPIHGAHLPVEVHCVVYYLADKPQTTRNREVSHTFWYSIEQLLTPERFDKYPVRFGDQHLMRPGIRILRIDQPVLWGITYRLLGQFFGTMKIPFPSCTP